MIRGRWQRLLQPATGAWRLWGAVLLVLLWSAWCSAASLTESPWRLSADRIIYQQQPRVVEASGNVLLIRRSSEELPLEIAADWLRFEVDGNRLAARGSIAIRSETETLHADAARIDLNAQTGTITNTTLFLPRNQLHFKGDVVEKQGELTYHFTHGWVTACLPPAGEKPPWSIRAADVQLTVEGYAVLRHATLRIKEVPVLYTPYLILPAKTVRQTGFLFPEISQSQRNGTGLMTPFFINLSPSSDLTLYPGFLEQRGPLLGAVYRYMLGPDSQGHIAAVALRDDLVDQVGDDYKNDGVLRTRRDRYWLRAKIDHDFGSGLVARADFDVVSDRDFLQEYRGGLMGYAAANEVAVDTFSRDYAAASLPFRPSTVQLAKHFSAAMLGVEALAVKELWGTRRSQAPLQVLPRASYNGHLNLAALPVTVRWQSEYANFWRRAGVGGSRLDLAPEAVLPLPVGRYVEGSMTLGVRETLYRVHEFGDRQRWSGGRSQGRTVPEGRLYLASALVRDYGGMDDQEHLTHLVRPEMEFNYIPDVEQRDLPYFDRLDRIAPSRSLTYGLVQQLHLLTERGDMVRRPYLAALEIHQTYDLYRANAAGTVGGKPFSDLLVELDIFALDHLRLQYETTWSVHGQGVTSYDMNGRIATARGDALTVAYRYKLDPEQEAPYFYRDSGALSVHELNVDGEMRLTSKIALQGDISHSFSTDNTSRAGLQLRYTPGCWSMELTATKTPDDTRLAVIFSLTGLGKLLDLGMTR